MDVNYNINDSMKIKKKKKRKSSQMSSDANETDLSISFISPKKLKSFHDDEYRSGDMILLETALEHLESGKGVNDEAYIKGLKNLNYEELAQKAGFDEPTKCEEKLKKLISKTTKLKSLHQLLSETIQQFPERKHFRNSFVNFMGDNKEAVDEVRNKLGCDKMSAAASLWKELSPKEREHYETNEQMDAMKEENKTPFQFYYSHCKKKFNMSFVDAKSQWSNLAMKKKVKYIERSVEVMIQAEHDCIVLNDTKVMPQGPATEHLKGPNKQDVELYLKHKGVPDMPLKTVALLYYKEKVLDKTEEPPPRNILILAIQKFKGLAEKKQKIWAKKFADVWEVYRNQIAEWKESQNKLAVYIYEKNYENKKKETKVKKVTIAELTDSLNKIEMPVNNKIKFRGEPQVTSITPQSIFIEARAGKSGDKKNACKEYFSLDAETKKKYVKKSDAAKQKLKETLIEFTEGLYEEQRKLFLGVRRLKCIKLLKEDIFEEKYPCVNYPVYIPHEDGTKDTKIPSPNKPKSTLANHPSPNKQKSVSQIVTPTRNMKPSVSSESSDSDESSSASETLASLTKITPKPRPKTSMKMVPKESSDGESDDRDSHVGLEAWTVQQDYDDDDCSD